VQIITREENYRGESTFQMWSEWNERYQNGARWKLTETDQVLEAMKLAKKYKIEMRRI
jgi:predicted P-loop ATPase